MPNDGKRDVPDVSLFAADGLNASFYVACETDLNGGCTDDVDNLIPIGGTSVYWLSHALAVDVLEPAVREQLQLQPFYRDVYLVDDNRSCDSNDHYDCAGLCCGFHAASGSGTMAAIPRDRSHRRNWSMGCSPGYAPASPSR